MICDRALYNSWTRLAASIIANWKNETSSELDVIGVTVGIVSGESRTSRLQRLNQFCELMQPDMDKMMLLNRLNESGVLSSLIVSDSMIEYEISDLASASDALGITGRMLGYAIAYIGGTAEFSENTVHVTIKGYHPPEDAQPERDIVPLWQRFLEGG